MTVLTTIPPEDLAPLEGRPHDEPWYGDPDLIGATRYDTPDGGALDSTDCDIEFDEEMRPVPGEQFIPPGYTGEAVAVGMARARYLPEDTYLPQAEVRATLIAARYWGKAVDVSWMEMDIDDQWGYSVPVQQHAHSAIFAGGWFDEPVVKAGGFVFQLLVGVELDSRMIRGDVVTHIRLVNIVPDPDSPAEIRKRAAKRESARLAQEQWREEMRTGLLRHDLQRRREEIDAEFAADVQRMRAAELLLGDEAQAEVPF